MDWAALWSQFDTLLMGCLTFEVANTRRNLFSGSGQQWIVVSRTLKPKDNPGITILSNGIAEAVTALKAQPGPQPQKDIWLMGGGILFRSMLDCGLVDAIDVNVMPVLLGSGIPLLPEGRRRSLHLETSKSLPCGILMLKYSVQPERA
jgi:dihydrofolate reductase